NIGLNGAGRPGVIFNGGNYYTINTGAYNFLTRSGIESPADGSLVLYNNGRSGFGSLQFGGTSGSFPELLVNGSSLEVIGADGSTNSNLLVTGSLEVGTTTATSPLTVSATPAQL